MIALLILANGVLAGAEIALVSVRRTRLAERAEAGAGWARSALALRENPERFLATVQVGITVIGTTAGAFGGSTLAIHLMPVFQAIPALRPYAEEIAVGLVVALVSFLSIVAGELVPKSLALRAPEAYARLVATPLMVLSRISGPAVRLLAGASNLILRVFGDRTSFTEARLSSEEVRHLVEDAARVGSLHPSAGEIASRAIGFGDLRACDVMVPRNAVVAVAADSTLAEAAALLELHPYSRLPVREGADGEVIGYLAAKDLAIRFQRDAASAPVRDLLRRPAYVPETLRVTDLLALLQRERQRVAVVVDETGDFAGLVTMEDLLEELVGEIASEFRQEGATQLTWDADGTAVVKAALPVREVNRQLGTALPETGGWSSLAGLLLHRWGRIPQAGEALEVVPGLRVEVVQAGPTRIVEVRLARVPSRGAPG